MNYRQRLKKYTCAIMAFLMVCLFVVPQRKADARENFVSQFIQTVFTQKNGIGSNEVNCLYQSSSGYIWIGTDGGLYRYNGSSFQSINLWDTDRTDVYSINTIMQDSKGRVWVGTDNYGLFYIENGSNHHLQNEYYSGIKTIYDICEMENGEIYIGTSEGLFYVDETGSEVQLNQIMGDFTDQKEVNCVEAYDDAIWAVCNNRYMYVISAKKTISKEDLSLTVSDDISCMKAIDGKLYVGTAGKNIVVFSSGRNEGEIITAEVEGINNMMKDSQGRIWVCGDNGLGYFVGNNFIKISDCKIDSYLSDMIQDYEGNYWVSSTRMGVLLLSRSKFVDYNMRIGMPETMVNAVFVKGSYKYIGTDDGLIIYDRDETRVSDDLTNMLNGISIRSITSDDEGNIWIGTYRRYGVVRVTPKGEITYTNRSTGLAGSTVNCIYILADGNVAVGTDNGITILDKSGRNVISYGKTEGISYGNITCLFQDEKGILYAGTDGEGIYAVKIGTNPEITRYTMENGLNSNVISAIISGEQGIWIGTDNGMCFYNEAFRSISNIEYSNSIYDILIRDNYVWIVGSMGVLCTTEEELLGSQGVVNRYYDASDGLTKTLNTISDSYIDNGGILYICCNDGICTLNTKNIPRTDIPPRIKVTSIDVDGKTYEFDDLVNGLSIENDADKITIEFAVFSFSNRDDIKAEYMLKGFDKEPIVLSGNDTMKAVYTNLEGGVYEFEINAYNGDGVSCEKPISFIIEMEPSFFENPVARAGIIGAFIVLVVLLIFGALRVKNLLVNKNQALEKLSREHEEAVKTSSAKNDYLANMSNEIKTPINAMVAKADELMHILSDAASKEIVESICNIGNDIIGKVDDIILLAKIEAGKVDTIKAPYSVTTMIYELSEMVTGKLADKAVKFFVEIGEEIVDNLIGDEVKIKDIMMRILDNSIKYTKEGSITLAVDCYRYTDKDKDDIVNLVFSVSDTGIGIQDDRIDSIFEIYNIADNVKNSIHSGNGVGLAIAKGYAELMDADIEVESTYGAGSTFTLTLNQRVALNQNANHAIYKIEEMVSKEIAEKLWLPEANALLVDDEEVSRQVSQKILNQFEMKVDVATSGINAIDMVMNNSYDVVFMDLSMPIMNGIDAMNEIRDLSEDRYKMLPIVAMDNDAIEENKEKLLAAGFTDSIVKPMDIRRVAAILKDCLPENLIKEKANDIASYISGSRYGDGLAKLRPYMDVEYAIEKIGGSIDVYNKLLRMFYEQNAAASEELYKKAGKDVRGFKIKIHALRTASMNIGATALAHQATRMEGAINIGNREYINENVESFLENLVDVLLAVEDYNTFVDSISGTGDEEYNGKGQEPEIIDAGSEDIAIYLKEIEKMMEADDFAAGEQIMDRLLALRTEGEDREFISALNNLVRQKDKEGIRELIDTYFALKL